MVLLSLFDDGQLAAADRVVADVAAADGLLVVLLGEHGVTPRDEPGVDPIIATPTALRARSRHPDRYRSLTRKRLTVRTGRFTLQR